MTDLSLEYTYCELPKSLYTPITPKQFTKADLVLFNKALATEIGIDLAPLDKTKLVQTLLGSQLPEHAQPIAMAYSGHQFGYFSHLGDGRAFLLGEHVTPKQQRVDIHLKGAGRTVYARNGDGNAVLGPMLREYIISEAMHALKIPTTRSLAVIQTGEPVFRHGYQPGAILVRIASSHIRFGTFQLAATQGKEVVQKLLDYTVNRHFPHLHDQNQPLALAFLNQILEQLAKLIVNWERVGFIHGVMNTDNMAISGETFDYGPCAFMDSYSPSCVFSSIDTNGRYAFKNQAPIAQWNLARLAETLLPFIDNRPEAAIDAASQVISSFTQRYKDKWLEMMRNKLGLLTHQKEDEALIDLLLTIMHQHTLDYSNTFFKLTYDKDSLPNYPALQDWITQWQKRIQIEANDAVQEHMKATNPTVIPRNHRVEHALNLAEQSGDLTAVNNLLSVLETPYALSEKAIQYNTPPLPEERIEATFCGT